MATRETPVSIAMDNESKAGAKMAESQSSLDSVSTVFVNAMCAIVIVCSLTLCVGEILSVSLCERKCESVHCTAVFCIIVLNIHKSGSVFDFIQSCCLHLVVNRPVCELLVSAFTIWTFYRNVCPVHAY